VGALQGVEQVGGAGRGHEVHRAVESTGNEDPDDCTGWGDVDAST
jgi:hypothetical protein